MAAAGTISPAAGLMQLLRAMIRCRAAGGEPRNGRNGRG